MQKLNRLALVLILVVLSFTCIFAACDGPAAPATAPEKVADGIDIKLAVGQSKNIQIADYIKTNGVVATASSSDESKATVAIVGNLMKITAVAEGSAQITLTCQDITVKFGVTVPRECTVTVNGTATKVFAGETFTLPQAPAASSENVEFDHWLVGEEVKNPGDTIVVTEDVTVVVVEKQKEAVKVADGTAMAMVVGDSSQIVVANYITAYGRNVSVSSSDASVTAVLADGVVTVTAASKGSSVVTIACGNIQVTFDISVSAKTFTITIDGAQAGRVEDGATFTLPDYAGQLEENHEFIGWVVNGDADNLKKAGDSITVTANVTIVSSVQRKAPVLVKDNDQLTLTVEDITTVNVADYVTAYGNEVAVASNNASVTAVLEDGVVTITAVSQGSANVTITCGNLTATIAVTVNPKVVAPAFENGTINVDLFLANSGSYTAVVTNPSNMTLAYSLEGENSKASIDQSGTITYAADVAETVTLTVKVVATSPYASDPINATFTVEVVVVDTTPAAPVFEDVQVVCDAYSNADGVVIADKLVASNDAFSFTYSVDGQAITSEYKFTKTTVVTVNYTYLANSAKSGSTTFTVTVDSVDTTPAIVNPAIVVEDVVDLINVPTINLAANVTNAANVKGYKVNGSIDFITDGIYTIQDNNYTENATQVTFEVTVINTKDQELSYTYTVSLINTRIYTVVNGGFETGDLTGWTVTDGMGRLDEANDYWNGILYQKEGRFFFLGIENELPGVHTLQSSTFVVGGSGWITFQMGAAPHFAQQYVEVVKANTNEVIARVSNFNFQDKGGFEGEGDANKVSGLTLMKYKLDLSSAMGETVYVRVTDAWESVAFGFVLFDNLVSYVPNADSIGADYVDANAAHFTNTQINVDLKDTNTATVVPSWNSDGLLGTTYTYVGVAEGLTVDGLTLTATKSGNFVVNYTVYNGETAVGSFEVAVAVANTTQLPTLEDVANAYEPTDWNTSTAVEIDLPQGDDRFAYSFSADKGEIVGGKLIYTPSQAGEVVITVTVALSDKNYTVEDLGTVTFTVTLTFKEDAISVPTQTPADEHYDVFDLVQTDNLVVDFAAEKYITVPASKVDSTVYAATLSVNDGDAQAIELANNNYAISLQGLTDVATKYTFVVTATCGDEVVSYTLNVYLTDSTVYRIENGGFENGIVGWEVIGNVGAVSTENNYWVGDPVSAEGFSFRKDGQGMFSAYAPGIKEDAVGTLTSSPFVVATNRTITFKLGAALHDVFVEIVDAQTGVIYASYANPAWGADKPNACALHAYKAVLPQEAAGKTVYVRIVDSAINNYGLFFCDSFVTYYAEVPAEGFIDAVDVATRPATIYDVYNGGFETGNLDGWRTHLGEIGVVSNANAYWEEHLLYGKEGEWLFTGVGSFGADTLREGNVGTLTSSLFTLKAGSYLSFKVAGGVARDMYVSVIDVITGNAVVLRNEAFQDGVLKDHYFQNTTGNDMLCYVKVVDFESSNWGCFALDAFATSDVQPAGTQAIDHAAEYANVFNGSFETGNLDGWTHGEWDFTGLLGVVTNTEKQEGWYQTNEGRKDGDYLFTFYDGFTNFEGGRGILRSKMFVLEKNGIITFRFGAAWNAEVYINLYNADGSLVAQFRNGAQPAGSETLMNYYYYQSNLAHDTTLYFEIVDNATSGYGCFVVDDFRANVGSIPEGAIAAHN